MVNSGSIFLFIDHPIELPTIDLFMTGLKCEISEGIEVKGCRAGLLATRGQ